MDSYDEWLKSVTDKTSLETANPSWVVTDTCFAFDENDRIIGIIDLRHELNDFLKDFGNSGYNVRPSERRKGYATEMLRLIIRRAAEIGCLCSGRLLSAVNYILILTAFGFIFLKVYISSKPIIFIAFRVSEI